MTNLRWENKLRWDFTEGHDLAFYGECLKEIAYFYFRCERFNDEQLECVVRNAGFESTATLMRVWTPIGFAVRSNSVQLLSNCAIASFTSSSLKLQFFRISLTHFVTAPFEPICNDCNDSILLKSLWRVLIYCFFLLSVINLSVSLSVIKAQFFSSQIGQLAFYEDI